MGELVQGEWDRVVWVARLELGSGSCPIIKHPFELGQGFSSCPFSVLFGALPVATRETLGTGRGGQVDQGRKGVTVEMLHGTGESKELWAVRVW